MIGRSASIICILAAIAFFQQVGPPAFAGRTEATERETDQRLADLCRVWGRAKLFHPALGYRTDIDWDAALVDAVPRVCAARSDDEFMHALQSMLSRLGDPATRVFRPSAGGVQSSEPRDLQTRVTRNGTVLISVHSYFDLTSAASEKQLGIAIAALPKSRAAVIDIRAGEPGGEYGDYMLNATLKPVVRLITKAPLATAGERRRVHFGWDGGLAFSSGQYRSVWETTESKSITPAANAADIRSVFIVNRYSSLLPAIAPLQASGKALVVYDGDPSEYAGGRYENVDLRGGLTAAISSSEAVLPDGASGSLMPDRIVRSARSGDDAATAAALTLAQSSRVSHSVRKRLPLGLARPESSYAGLAYPSLPYRLLAAFRIWNTIHYFYPFKESPGGGWDDVLTAFVPVFRKAETAWEYNLAIAGMMRTLRDSHIYINGAVFNAHVGTAYTPIRVSMVEGLPVITSFRDRTAAEAAGAEIGDIVLKVDGEDAAARLARYRDYLSGSTPAGLDSKAALQFLCGGVNSSAVVRVRKQNGEERDLILKRKFEDYTTLYHHERTGPIVRRLNAKIGYADLDRLTAGMVDAMFSELAGAEAIIFDMRGYPNETRFALAARLAAKVTPAALVETVAVGTIDAHSLASEYQFVQPGPAAARYAGRTVMLIDERTQSQAEHTGLFLRAANGTKFIGTPSAGADGEVTAVTVPGGITIGFTGQSVKFPDGRPIQRVGLMPDIESGPTLTGIREGRDEVLERAIQYLSEAR